MYISRLALDQYRSWNHCILDFQPGVNILQGANGLGKTNIVEAIEVLSTGSSHRTSSSLPLIRRGNGKATIRANVVFPAENIEISPLDATTDDMRDADFHDHSQNQEAAVRPAQSVSQNDFGDFSPSDASDGSRIATFEATIAARGANRARINGGNSLYLRDIVGQIPSISFTPEDQRLISGDPATRRTLLNQAGALLIPGYAERLQQCARIAKQRATLLKQLGQREDDIDATLSGLEIWTEQFTQIAVQITRDRAKLVEKLSSPFTRILDELAGSTQNVKLSYVPSMDEVLAYEDPIPHISQHFQRLYAGEVSRGQNLIGPHRDDLALRIDDIPVKEFASNGEMWTMALALKMALHEVVTQMQGLKPLVILDDVFAQLDEHRRQQILEFARHQDQVIITVAAASDIPDISNIADIDKQRIIDVSALVEQDNDDMSALVRQLQAEVKTRRESAQSQAQSRAQASTTSAADFDGTGVTVAENHSGVPDGASEPSNSNGNNKSQPERLNENEKSSSSQLTIGRNDAKEHLESDDVNKAVTSAIGPQTIQVTTTVSAKQEGERL